MQEKQLLAMQKKMQIIRLFDFYGNLLTENQQDMITQHYEDDLTLAEIAQAYNVSRQGVHDTLQRAVNQLFQFEEKLGLCQQFDTTQTKLKSILTALQPLEKMTMEIPEITKAKQIIQSIIGEEGEQNGI